MLDPLVYRAAFLPALFALVLAAFSLVDRPRPLRTTLSADAFDESGRAFARLQQLARAFPDRRPGSDGDERLAGVLADRMRSAGFRVTTRTDSGATIDGKRSLKTVIATRAGQPGKGIVVVAHRDAAGRGAIAELSGTAALDELVQVFEGRSTRRTLTLVSTSGGGAGAAAFARTLRPSTTSAVLVLGDIASARVRKPWVLPWSDGPQLAPARLRRTAEAAVREETGQDAGGIRASSQLGRLAFPFALGDQGRFNERGIPAVMLQASGERGPEAGAAVSADHLRVFGRAALRTIGALDAGAALDAGPGTAIVLRRKVLPRWSVQLLVGALLLPAALAAIDGLARARRRRLAIAPWAWRIAALAAPFAVAALLARLLGLTGIVSSPPAPVPGGDAAGATVAVIVVGLGFVLSWLALRPLQRLTAAGELGDAPAAALSVTTVAIAVLVWTRNPYAAAILLLPAHLWLLGSVLRLPRVAAALLLSLSLLPAIGVLVLYARAVGLSAFELPSSLVMLAVSGHVGVVSLATMCALAGCALAAGALALRDGWRDEGLAIASGPAIRGPAGYAGPGSLGGTESEIGLRR